MALLRPITFDPFVLDPLDERLFRDGEPVALTPKSFGVLRHLISHAGRLVTKDELLRVVWEDACVGDGSLKVCVREIRHALGDSAHVPRFVETVHRRGYRFIAKPASAASPTAAPAELRETCAEPQPRRAAPNPKIVGRRDEQQRLRELLAAATRGERQIAFVTGEPGSGKTTLVDAFVKEAAQAGAWVAVGQCFQQFGTGEAFCPVLEAIGQLCRNPRHELLFSLLSRHAPTWLVQMPSVAEAVGLAAPAREVLGATAERMLREACELFDALTSEATLVLVLEDLHWGDYSTVDLVSALARRGRPARLLVIATYRPVEVILSAHPLKGVKQEMLARRICDEISLEGLSVADVAEYLAQRFPESLLPDGLPQSLMRRTEGNPLFLANLIDDWESQGVFGDGAGRGEFRAGPPHGEASVPESVRALIEKRVERLEDQERLALEAASVAGVEFAAAAVAAALDADELDVEACCEGLARRHLILERKGEIVWPNGMVSGRYRFLHELYRDVIYGRIPTAKRTQLHQRLAERLEAAHGSAAPRSRLSWRCISRGAATPFARWDTLSKRRAT
jgi:predicted ATPase/DNA-binding winged helix-turn-helix (wHTH) protein